MVKYCLLLADEVWGIGKDDTDSFNFRKKKNSPTESPNEFHKTRVYSSAFAEIFLLTSLGIVKSTN